MDERNGARFAFVSWILVVGARPLQRAPAAIFAVAGALVACARTSPTEPAGAGADVDAGAACKAPLVWSTVAGSPGGVRITGSGPSDVWLIANPDADSGAPPKSGILMRGDGTTWSAVTDLTSANAPLAWMNALAVWVGGTNDAFVGVFGDTAVFRWDGAGWTEHDTGDNREVDWLWGSGPRDVWGTRSDGQYLGHWDGQSWSHIDSVNGGVVAGGSAGDWWRAFWPASRSNDAFGFVHHEPTEDGCGGAADAGQGGEYTLPSGVTCCVVYPNGESCGRFDPAVTAPAQDCPAPRPGEAGLGAAWASATDDVWFMGARAYHYDGSSWTCPSLPTTIVLESVGGTSRNDVWAVGDGGTILHFDGAAWHRVSSPTTADLLGVWASGPCDVWAIGDAVYHAHPPNGELAADAAE